MRVYLVYFFQDYINMYDPVHAVKHVVLTEEKAIELVGTENARLKKRSDYHTEQNAFIEAHEVLKP